MNPSKPSQPSFANALRQTVGSYFAPFSPVSRTSRARSCSGQSTHANGTLRAD